jgi:hypothetical protein
MVIDGSTEFRLVQILSLLQTICIIPPTTLQLVGGSSMEAWRGRHGAANGSSAPEATAWSAGDLAFWMCRKSEVLTDFMWFYDILWWLILSSRNYRTWSFYRLCQFAACSFFTLVVSAIAQPLLHRWPQRESPWAPSGDRMLLAFAVFRALPWERPQRTTFVSALADGTKASGDGRNLTKKNGRSRMKSQILTT